MQTDPSASQGTERKTARVLSRPVVLIGLMGAGKSSVGVKLAQMLDVPFHDSDAAIVEAAQMEIPEIFNQFGEPEFRRLERRVIARLLDEKSGVIATGGGAFIQAETRGLILDRAVSVWLKAELEVLFARTAGRSHRPLLNQGDPKKVLSDLMAKRYPVYAHANLHVESLADQTHEEMAGRIVRAMEEAGYFL